MFLAISNQIKLSQGLQYLFRNLFSIFTFEVLKSGLKNCISVIYKSQSAIKHGLFCPFLILKTGGFNSKIETNFIKIREKKDMKTGNTFGIQFIIRQDKIKNDKAPIYARITVNGKIVHFAL